MQLLPAILTLPVLDDPTYTTVDPFISADMMDLADGRSLAYTLMSKPGGT